MARTNRTPLDWNEENPHGSRRKKRLACFQGRPGKKPERLEKLPPPPPWRDFPGDGPPDPGKDDYENPDQYRGSRYQADLEEVEMVNAALYLRRPLLVTGPPGAGKSTLAYAVAWELGLGDVLRWPITTRTTLQDGLYTYDAIGRLQESQRDKDAPTDASAERKPEPGDDLGKFIRLGPLGTALLPAEKPRVLLIDEIDKSDIDLPNDLLHIFEEGRFPIPELVRLGENHPPVDVYPCEGVERSARIRGGEVVCKTFPFILLTSNGERELPAPFIRRCVRLDIPPPRLEKLERIITAHFGAAGGEELDDRTKLIGQFLEKRDKQQQRLSTDQLLNAIHLIHNGEGIKDWDGLVRHILRPMDR